MCRCVKWRWLLFAVLLFAVLLFAGACNLGTTDAPTPTPTPALPTTEFLAPPNNSQVYEGTDFTLDVVARDPTDGIARIELFVDGEKINEAKPAVGVTVPTLRAEMNWLANGLGKHALTLVAYRLDGTRSDEAILTIEVVPREDSP